MFYYSKKGKTQLKCKKDLCAVYGEGTVTDWTCQKRFARFHSGEFLLDDVPRSGRPVEVDSDQIKTLTENNQWSTIWEIADIVKYSNQWSYWWIWEMCLLQKKLNGLFGQPDVY